MTPSSASHERGRKIVIVGMFTRDPGRRGAAPSKSPCRLAKLKYRVAGGGVIGCTTAYYLTRHPSYSADRCDITILEAGRLAGGASGKAGGLLAQWAYPASLVSLSFDLHQDLAAEHDGDRAWGYRTIRCGKLTARDPRLPDEPSSTPALAWAAQQIASWVSLGKRREVNKDGGDMAPVQVPDDLDWFRREAVTKYEDVAPQKETAQVHPYHFTVAMANLAEQAGVRVITRAAAEEIEYGAPDEADEAGSGGGAALPRTAARAVRYVDKNTARSIRLPADVVILAAGPWTPALFPEAPVGALRAHSVIIKPARPLSAYCLFTEVSMARGEGSGEGKGSSEADGDAEAGPRIVSPEIYSRPNNEVYVAGEGDVRVPLPAGADDVEVNRAACRLIEEAVMAVSDELRSGTVTGRRACYLPTVDVPSGAPLVGPTWVDGLLLATGHGCWGIHNAPATGKLISEIVFDGDARSADISALDPRKVI